MAGKWVCSVTNTELVKELREHPAFGYEGDLMLKAASRIEDMDERVAIMQETIAALEKQLSDRHGA